MNTEASESFVKYVHTIQIFVHEIWLFKPTCMECHFPPVSSVLTDKEVGCQSQGKYRQIPQIPWDLPPKNTATNKLYSMNRIIHLRIPPVQWQKGTFLWKVTGDGNFNVVDIEESLHYKWRHVLNVGSGISSMSDRMVIPPWLSFCNLICANRLHWQMMLKVARRSPAVFPYSQSTLTDRLLLLHSSPSSPSSSSTTMLITFGT